MFDSCIYPQEYSSSGAPAVPVQPPNWPHQDAEPHISSSVEEALLRASARRVAQGWGGASKGKSHRFLRRKWQAISKSNQNILRHFREPTGEEPPEAADGRWLRENQRLLRAVLQETRESLKIAARLPEIGPSSDPIKRAYAAATAYLRAVDFKYQDETFLIFCDAAQDIHPLDISELWAFKPMIQLILLEELAIAAERLVGTASLLDSTGQRAGRHKPHIPTLINSLRDLGNGDWKALFEKISRIDRILAEDPSGTYSQMDFESRDQYRQVIQDLSEASEASELEIAQRAIGLARAAQVEWSSDPRVRQRRRHVGYYLVDKGRELLEAQFHYRPPFLKQVEKTLLAWPEVFYLVGIELLTLAAVAFVVTGALNRLPLIFGLVLLLIPATEAAVGTMNHLVTFLLKPRALPKLDFSEAIPAEFTTLVVVPTVLTDDQYVVRMARDLEVRYLANRDPNLHFALLTDSPDSSEPPGEGNELIDLCSKLIEQLNAKYARHGQGSFFLFHRAPVFNPSEGAWMGWERKRGKLLDLNDALRGNRKNFSEVIGDLTVLPKVRFVITLDSDTQLPRGAAHRLIGALAHPLNRAVIDPRTNMVVEGYGILQPRVGISVHAASRSLLASIYSGQTGFDLYTRATSDVYQDLFGEGSFTGKGIYEVDIFYKVLARRFPCNTILSHDLIEGNYARTALVSDIEVIDDYPSHFSAYSRRKHRWTRGDWQIIWWLLPRVPDAQGGRERNPLTLISRWKILDNLRRSVVEAATFILLLAGWFSLPGSPYRWTIATLILMLSPVYAQLLLSLFRSARVPDKAGLMTEVAENFISGQVNVFFQLAFLPYQTLVMLDAIVRTLIRLTITRRKLLEWETAAQAEGATGRTRVDAYRGWSLWLSLGIGAVLALCRPEALGAALPLLILWAISNALARWLNQALRPARTEISARDQEFLRSTSLRTWRYFRQLAGEDTHGLVPDNIREDPPVAAQRISPTNLGLLLNAPLAALELGYLTLPEFVNAAERTLATATRLPRFRGHFYNWYSTQTLEPLEPRFVSSVDSGNLACCLWTLKQGCLKWKKQPPLSAEMWRGLIDHINLMDEIAGSGKNSEEVCRSLRQLAARVDLLGSSNPAWSRALPVLEQELAQILERLLAEPEVNEELRWWASETAERIRQIRAMIHSLTPWLLADSGDWGQPAGAEPPRNLECVPLDLLPAALAELFKKLEGSPAKGRCESSTPYEAAAARHLHPDSILETENLARRLDALAGAAGALVDEMDFRFLYNPGRKALSVGYDITRQRLETSCYDLLASEARAAVFVAIAKGEIPQEAWFRLARTHFQRGRNRVLLSWSGTMFEYLMPTLWIRNCPRTILDRSTRAAVQAQQEWAEKQETPWGISEAAYSETDAAGNYQYRAFGVHYLAIQKASPNDFVVAPYATFLSLAIDPLKSVRNLQRMQQMNWVGRFGFYESADFAPSRVTQGKNYELVRCWMAHHQGMSLLAVCNLLGDGVIQNLFHAEPAVAATELLLHEKLPPTVPVEPYEEEWTGTTAKAKASADIRGVRLVHG